MAAVPWWVTAPFWWGVANPEKVLIGGIALRYAPVPVARTVWALAAEFGPATLGLTARVAQIAYEEFALVRGGVSVVTKGVPILAAGGLGYTLGAVIGSTIVSQAEKKEIVYEGATEDVLGFYLGKDDFAGWKDYFGGPQSVASHYKRKAYDALGLDSSKLKH
jgi:hypothetical protein